MKRVLLFGAGGRMGKLAIEAILECQDLKIVAGIETPNHPDTGHEISGVPIKSDTLPYPEANIWLEFSLAEPAIAHIAAAGDSGLPIIVASTGFSADQIDTIKASSSLIAILLAPNLSIGMAALEQVTRLATQLLAPDFDVAISELHHKAKKDAPSGSANKIAEVVAEITERPGIVSIRGGGATGEHSVRFLGRDEELVITHRTWTRGAFARGIPRALRFISDQKPGLYTIQDVLKSG